MGKLERQYFVNDPKKSTVSISSDGVQMWIYTFDVAGKPLNSWLDVSKADVPVLDIGTIIVVETTKDDPPSEPRGYYAVPSKLVMLKAAATSQVTFHEGWNWKSVDPANPWPPPPPPPPP